MEDTQTAAPVAEGVSEGTESQVTAPPEQSAGQQQDATQVQGREPGQLPSSESAGRPKPSEYYRERKETRQLREQLRELQQWREDELAKRRQASAPEPQKPARSFDRDKFWVTPEEVLAEREKAIREEMEATLEKKLEERLNKTLTEREKATAFERQQQEALELFFPKESADSKETLQQRIAKDPAKVERLQTILVENGLDELSDQVKAAKIAMKLYAEEVKAQAPKKDPNVIKKSLVGSTATSAAGGAKGPATIEEIRSEKAKLEKEKDANPAVMFNDDFRKKWNLVKEQYTKLIKESGNNNAV